MANLEPVNGKHRRRPPRGVDVLAVLFLGAAALGSIAGLGYAVIAQGSETSVSTLGLIATGAIGALAAILSGNVARNDKSHEDDLT